MASGGGWYHQRGQGLKAGSSMQRREKAGEVVSFLPGGAWR